MAGTALYLAPELFDGRAATPASDIYSLGVLLYRLVTQDYPVNGVDRFAIENAHRTGQVKRLRDARPDLSTTFVEAVESALSSDPAKRPQTAGELEAALTRRDGNGSKTDRGWNMVKIASAIAATGRHRRGWHADDEVGGTGAATVWTCRGTRWKRGDRRRQPAAADPASYSIKSHALSDAERRRSTADAGHEPRPRRSAFDAAGIVRPGLRLRHQRRRRGQDLSAVPTPAAPAGQSSAACANRLPSNEDNWLVTDEGGREHFVIWVSRTKDVAVDAIMRAIPAASDENKPRRVALQSSEVEVAAIGRRPEATSAADRGICRDRRELLL